MSLIRLNLPTLPHAAWSLWISPNTQMKVCNLQEKTVRSNMGESLLKGPIVFSWMFYKRCTCTGEHPDMKQALQSVLRTPWEQEPVCLINQRGVEPDNADTM